MNSALRSAEPQGQIHGVSILDQNDTADFLPPVDNDNSQFARSPSVSSSKVGNVAERWFRARHPLSKPSESTLQEWKTYRFVKLGWFTAQEAVTYVDLFFQNMSNLSPILTDYYREHSNHHNFITREPVLCCTIITLSSRYHLLAGEGGLTRGFYVHDRMWKHCQSLFHQVVWSQRRSIKDQTRDLGTIESFLLVTEWHPRSAHLPSDFDNGESEPINRDDEESLRNDKGFNSPVSVCLRFFLIIH